MYVRAAEAQELAFHPQGVPDGKVILAVSADEATWHLADALPALESLGMACLMFNTEEFSSCSAERLSE